VGLFTSDDEWPDWWIVLDQVRDAVFGLVVARFGIFALVTGNILGRLVGVGLLLFAVVPVARGLRRRRSPR
jgi:hypothetical protein